MIYLSRSFSILISTLLLFASPVQSELIDRVVAEVNNDVITLSELNEEARETYLRIAREYSPEDQPTIIRQAQEQLLESMIDRMLIRQEAVLKKITISEQEISATIDNVIKASNLTKETFQQKLEQDGVNEITFRQNIESRVRVQKLIARDVSSKIVISDEMILEAYDKEYTSQVDEGGFYLLQMGVSWGESEASRQSTALLYEDEMAARKKIEKLRKQAVSGEDFSELARKYSDLPSAADGGDIGVFNESEMAPSMKAAVINLKPGEVSEIIKTPAGYQFFKLLSNKEGGIVMQVPYDEVKDRLRNELFNAQIMKEYQEWLVELKERSYIKKML